ncbi:tetratricopeptide repeat protein [bacterium]|nr:tetratricopeptide repeat protein [bacterium]
MMKYIVLFLFLCPLAQQVAHAQAADERNTLRLAQTYEQAGRYEDALRYYQDLSRSNPQNSTYFEGLRRTLTALKRLEDVRQLLTERMQLQPKEFQLWVYRGGIFMQRGESDSAEADWEYAISLNTKNGQVYSLVADQCLNAREYEKGISYLKRGREALGSPQLFAFEIARASAMAMDFDGAMDEYLGYLRAVPQSLFQIQQQLSMYSEIPEALDAAVRRAREQADEYPSSESLRYLLAWLYMERKDYASAYQVYRDLDRIKHAGGMEILKFASRAFNDKAYREAARAFKDVVNEHPDATYLPQAEFQHARSIEELYATEGMPDALTPSTTNYPSTESVSSYQGAITLYEDVAEKYPGQPMASEALYRIGLIKFERFGDTDGALEILKDISESRRNHFGKADADILIGDIQLARGDIDAALEQYNAVLPSRQIEEATRRKLQYKIAEAYFFAGRFDTVTVLLGPLMEEVDTDIANDALDLTALIAQYSDPGELPLQRYARVLFLERQKKYSEAAAQAADLIAEFPTHDIVDLAWLKKAELEERTGDTAGAAESYGNFLATRTESFLRDRGIIGLARLNEEKLGNNARALELYEQLLNDYPYSQFVPQARERILELRKVQS